MSYEVLTHEEVAEYIQSADDKTARIIKDNLRKLEDDPYPRPGSGSGDKEKLTIDGEEKYRLHIGRSLTAFYDVIEEENKVHVAEILPIDEAHRRYG